VSCLKILCLRTAEHEYKSPLCPHKGASPIGKRFDLDEVYNSKQAIIDKTLAE